MITSWLKKAAYLTATLATGVLLYGLGASGLYALPIAWLRNDLGGCTYADSMSALRAKGIWLRGLQVARESRSLGPAGGLEHWQTPLGNFWAPPRTLVFFLVAEQLTNIYGEGQRAVQPGDIVLDCGANIGTFTRKALLRGAQLVVAIEPSPLNVESLRRTFQAEIAAGRVVVVPKGVWDKDDILKLNVYNNSALDSFVLKTRPEEPDTHPRAISLPLTTLDRIVAELGLARVDFIKMDIEGAERQALAGAKRTIGRFRPRMAIATENLDDDYQVVPELVAKSAGGYRTTCGICKVMGISVRPDVLFFSQ